MSYTTPLLKDTLSQSIYVELADATGHIVNTKRYPIEGGMFHGDMFIDRHLTPGLYQLKAYTAWMLNFDKRLIFTKTIDVLAEKEAVRMASVYQVSPDTMSYIWLRTDKTSYSPREKITVNIDVFDSLDFATTSDLSVSVTDLTQAVPHKNEKTIFTNYLYDDNINDTTLNVKYDIEYGIDFDGTFWLGKRHVPGSITVFQDSVKEIFAIITDNVGHFRQTLAFNDTVTFFVNAVSADNKKGMVVMDTLRPQSPRLELDPLLLDVYASNTSIVRGLNLSGVTVLDEVAIEGKKLNTSRPATKVHAGADQTVTGDWINDHNFTDIFQALMSKVPGLRYDPNVPSITLRVSQFSRFAGSDVSPLILVDGVPVIDIQQALSIPIRSVDFIDVLKFGSASAYGQRGAAGVIAIYTKKGSPTGFEKAKLQSVKWVGFSTASEFTPPDYSKAMADDYYDYRATIYWSPSVKTTRDATTTLSFYAADAGTKYRVVAEGVTAGGVPVRAEKIVEIVNGR